MSFSLNPKLPNRTNLYFAGALGALPFDREKSEH